MKITSENIDDILTSSGLIKCGFNKAERVGSMWMDVYEDNLGLIFSLTSYILNSGADKKSCALLSDLVDVAKDIIAQAAKAPSSSEILKRKNRVRELSKSVPESSGAVGFSGAVIKCAEDTRVFLGALKKDAGSISGIQTRLIREVYLKGRKFPNGDTYEIATDAADWLEEAENALKYIETLAGNVLDDSSADSFSLAADVVKAIRACRDGLVYSYLIFSDELMEEITKTVKKAEMWAERKTGVDAKRNPRMASSCLDELDRLWMDDQASKYVRAAKARGFSEGK
ncbi:MAG: hypothetical protein LUD29_06480 [Clostridia bacterium]|nr:hypothetical protein [Clostridia bacterium]